MEGFLKPIIDSMIASLGHKLIANMTVDLGGDRIPQNSKSFVQSNRAAFILMVSVGCIVVLVALPLVICCLVRDVKLTKAAEKVRREAQDRRAKKRLKRKRRAEAAEAAERAAQDAEQQSTRPSEFAGWPTVQQGTPSSPATCTAQRQDTVTAPTRSQAPAPSAYTAAGRRAGSGQRPNNTNGHTSAPNRAPQRPAHAPPSKPPAPLAKNPLHPSSRPNPGPAMKGAIPPLKAPPPSQPTVVGVPALGRAAGRAYPAGIPLTPQPRPPPQQQQYQHQQQQWLGANVAVPPHMYAHTASSAPPSTNTAPSEAASPPAPRRPQPQGNSFYDYNDVYSGNSAPATSYVPPSDANATGSQPSSDPYAYVSSSYVYSYANANGVDAAYDPYVYAYSQGGAPLAQPATAPPARQRSAPEEDAVIPYHAPLPSSESAEARGSSDVQTSNRATTKETGADAAHDRSLPSRTSASAPPAQGNNRWSSGRDNRMASEAPGRAVPVRQSSPEEPEVRLGRGRVSFRLSPPEAEKTEEDPVIDV